MNFSSLRIIWLDWHLSILGHQDHDDDDDNNEDEDEDQDQDDNQDDLSPRPKLPTVSCGQVLDHLKTLPELSSVEALHSRQMKITPKDGTARSLKLFCRCAGEPLVQALEILGRLRSHLESLHPNDPKSMTTRPFLLYQYLIDALLEVRKSHTIWEVGVGHEIFFKKHPAARAVRCEYVWYVLQIVYTIAVLTFPEDYREHLTEMEKLLQRHDWNEQLIFDSTVTYERSMKGTRPGLIAPVNQYPKRFLLFDQKVLRPFLVYNPHVYGHRLVPNECSLEKRSGKQIGRSILTRLGFLSLTKRHMT